MNVHLNTLRSPLSLMVSIGVMSLCGSTAAFADDVVRSAEHSGKSDNALETVVVTGSRAESRTVAQSLAPIDVISADDLAPFRQTELARRPCGTGTFLQQ